MLSIATAARSLIWWQRVFPMARRLLSAFRCDQRRRNRNCTGAEDCPERCGGGREAARLWLRWLETLFSEPEADNPTWLPDRMEYAFSVGTAV